MMRKQGLGAIVQTPATLKYVEEYLLSTGGTAVYVDAEGTTMDISATVDGMSEGDALVMAPGNYTIFASNGNNAWNRFKNICFAGDANDPKDVVLDIDYSQSNDRDFPIFSTYNNNSKLHLYNFRYIRDKGTGGFNYTNAFTKWTAGGSARNVIFDLAGGNISWVYNNDGWSGPISYVRDCSFVNVGALQGNYSGNVTQLEMRGVISDNNLGTAFTSTGTNYSNEPFDANFDYAAGPKSNAGHLQGAYSSYGTSRQPITVNWTATNDPAERFPLVTGSGAITYIPNVITSGENYTFYDGSNTFAQLQDGNWTTGAMVMHDSSLFAGGDADDYIKIRCSLGNSFNVKHLVIARGQFNGQYNLPQSVFVVVDGNPITEEYVFPVYGDYTTGGYIGDQTYLDRIAVLNVDFTASEFTVYFKKHTGYPTTSIRELLVYGV